MAPPWAMPPHAVAHLIVQGVVPLRGRVIAGDGSTTSLPGARVAVVIDGRLAATVVSDAEGRFAVGVPARGGRALRVTKAGYAPVERAADALPAGEIQVVLLRGAASPAASSMLAAIHCPERSSAYSARAPVRCRPPLCGAPTLSRPTISASTAPAAWRPGATRSTSCHPSSLRQEALRAPCRIGARRWWQQPMRGAASRRPRRSFRWKPERRPCCTWCRRRRTIALQPPAPSRVRYNRCPLQIVRGRLLSAAGRPVAGASVELRSDTGARIATSDVQGRYEIYGIPPGEYRLSVRARGFPPVEYGQQRAMEQGTPITIRAGDVLERMDVRLPAATVITGRVVDAYGEPLEGINVRVLERRFRERRLVLASVMGASPRQTDDRGYYRLFGLLPGTYYVVAGDGPTTAERVRATTMAMIGSSAPSGIIPRGAVDLFHPGTPAVTEAVPVRVEPGGRRSGGRRSRGEHLDARAATSSICWVSRWRRGARSPIATGRRPRSSAWSAIRGSAGCGTPCRRSSTSR